MIEPRAWGALLYLLLTLATGIIYFTWTITGISLSLGLLILIIGIPIAGLFILSTRGPGAAGRPHGGGAAGRPHAAPSPVFAQGQGIWAKFKALLIDKYTWFSMVYMLLQLPLGIAYFTAFITLIADIPGIDRCPDMGWAFDLPMFVN